KYTANCYHAFRRRQPLTGHFSPEAQRGPGFDHANHTVIVAAHAGVRLESGASWQDLRIRGRTVGMSANDQGHLTVKDMPVCHLLAAGFRVDIGDNRMHGAAQPVARQYIGGPPERTIKSV